MKSKTRLLVGALTLMGALCWLSGEANTQTSDPVLIGAGDIGDCYHLDVSGALATAALINGYPTATVFAVGDMPHNGGTDADYAMCFQPAWGAFRSRMIPVPGNHDYYSMDAGGYYNYFGAAAGDPTKGYYSLNLGTWHIVVLNSECGHISGGCGAGSPQDQWLQSDLTANKQTCIMALWHEPYYTSSSVVAPATATQQLWADLYNAHAALIVNGHAHSYERFAPQDPNGNAATNGIVEIVAGTGGTQLFGFNSSLAANEVVRNNTAFGVLKLTLHSTSYDWQFIPISGQTFTDSGTQTCP